MTWDEYFFGIADAIAVKSHCLSRKIGAVAVRDGKFLVATGYNGPPVGYPHCTGKACPRRELGFQSGQGLYICPASHAERNVLIEAARLGTRLKDCTMYLTCSYPCRECAKEIVNAGIKEVVVTGGRDYPEDGLSGRQILGICSVAVRIGR